MKLFIVIIFFIQSSFGQKYVASNSAAVSSEAQALGLVYRAAKMFPDLESMINFFVIFSGKEEQLSALKSKIGARNFKTKLPKINFENESLILGSDKISARDGKVYFNEMAIPFNQKLSLAENYELIKTSLKNYKPKKGSALFNLLVPDVWAGACAGPTCLKAFLGVLATLLTIVGIIIAHGAFPVATSVITIVAALGGFAYLMYSVDVQASTFLQDYLENGICKSPHGSNRFSNSYKDKDGKVREEIYELEGGLLIVTSKHDGVDIRKIKIVPNSNDVGMIVYNKGNKDKAKTISKEDSEALQAIYKTCSDPKLRKEFVAKIKAYAEAQKPRGGGNSTNGINIETNSIN